ncbi:glycosyltransferase family 4 protein [Streptosporangium subroseum]|uniref:glycosyltransferase family 4 protein n=1 Tax=Streptosporangium subroseum TaxID=106412 RepID=UPI00343BE510
MSTPTIAVALHDGFFSCGTGAARSNRAFLEILVRFLSAGVRLVVLPVHLTSESSEYNLTWHQQMHDLVTRAGGEVISLDNGTNGHTRFGNLAAFRRLCAAGGDAITQEVLPAAGPLLIIAFDCPFYGLAAHLPTEARARLVAVAHSTAALHAPDDDARVGWERDGLHAVSAAGGCVAVISAHMRTHLIDDYRLPAESLSDLPNGLTATDWQRIAPPDLRLLPSAARSGFLLAMGRAVPYKGFDDLLDALVVLANAGVRLPHAVIAAVTDDPHPTPYQRHLLTRITTEKVNATLVNRFDPRLRSLLIHPALAAVVVPSRVEPFGLIPLEAFVAGAAPVVATTAGGLAELVTEKTGFPARPRNPASLASAIAKALAISPAERARLRAAGRHLTATRYNYETTVRGFLQRHAPWALAQAPTG